MNDEKNLQAGARGSHIRSPVCCVMPSHHYSKFVLPYKYAKNKTCVTKKCPVCVLVVCCLRMMRLAGPCGQGGGLEQGRQQMPGIRPDRADRGEAGLRGRCESAHSLAEGSTKCGFDVYYMSSILPARLRRGEQPCPVSLSRRQTRPGDGSRPASRQQTCKQVCGICRQVGNPGNEGITWLRNI